MSLQALIEKIKFGKYSLIEILKLCEAAEAMYKSLDWIAEVPLRNVDMREATYICEAQKAMKLADSICGDKP